MLLAPIITPGAQEAGEFLRFADGTEAFAPGGRLQPPDVAAALARAEGYIGKGQLRLASATLDLLERNTTPAPPATANLRARIRAIEFSSVVVLRDGRRIQGRLTRPFRADHLGLATKEELSPDLIRRVSVEYHLGWSAVSLTFYPLTVAETEFRDGRTLLGRFTQETPIPLEMADGRLVEVVLGRAYQLFRDEGLAKQMLAGEADRVARILVYSALPGPQR